MYIVCLLCQVWVIYSWYTDCTHFKV